MNINRNIILALLTFLMVIGCVPIVNARSMTPIFFISSSKDNLNYSQEILKQGMQLYEVGNFAAAAETWERAI